MGERREDVRLHARSLPPTVVASPAGAELQDGGHRLSAEPLGRELTLWASISEEHGVAARAATLSMDELGRKAQCCNLAGSFVIAFDVISTHDVVLGCVMTIIYTLCYWFWGQHLAVGMSWNIVSLAVIFPISQGISMGFKRREGALTELDRLLGSMTVLWGAIHTWNLKQPGSDAWMRVLEAFPDPAAAKHDLRALFEEFLTALVSYTSVKRNGRSRYSISGNEAELEELMQITHQQRLRVCACIARMQRLVQNLKTLGLPGGEAHRLDSYVCQMSIAFERVCSFKEYRTPQAFRAVARVYILLLGALYGPYYLWLSQGASGEERNLGCALVFACAMQIAMSGLFNVMLGLEDPFVRRADRTSSGMLDCIHVPSLADVARRRLLAMEKESSNDWRTHICDAPCFA
eukprot:Tamp_16979.p1 GENE.Tamp_16979~~Tamp_16979.p1  ORF type:complete len:406 (+),score=85.10 Tamp_16979:136-1353(+)